MWQGQERGGKCGPTLAVVQPAHWADEECHDDEQVPVPDNTSTGMFGSASGMAGYGSHREASEAAGAAAW